MDNFSLYLILGMVFITLFMFSVGIHENYQINKVKKAVETFILEVNSGNRGIYCSDKVGKSFLLDENGNIICFAKKRLKIKSDVFCFPHFMIQCYRASIEKWRDDDAEIVMYVKPLDNVYDKWRIEKVCTAYIECCHPIMGKHTIFMNNTSGYKAGEMVTLRSRVTSSVRFDVENHLDYEVVN